MSTARTTQRAQTILDIGIVVREKQPRNINKQFYNQVPRACLVATKSHASASHSRRTSFKQRQLTMYEGGDREHRARATQTQAAAHPHPVRPTWQHRVGSEDQVAGNQQFFHSSREEPRASPLIEPKALRPSFPHPSRRQ